MKEKYPTLIQKQLKMQSPYVTIRHLILDNDICDVRLRVVPSMPGCVHSLILDKGPG